MGSLPIPGLENKTSKKTINDYSIRHTLWCPQNHGNIKER